MSSRGKSTEKGSYRLYVTRRLVMRDSFAKALAELLAKLARYTVLVRRSTFSAEVIESDSPNLVIFEDEPLALDGKIDERLLRAKQVTLIATAQDRGTAKINLTTRTVEVLSPSSGLTEAVDLFNDQLLKGARSRWSMGGMAGVLVAIPLVALIIVPLIDMAVNRRVYKAINSNNKYYVPVPWDHWVGPALIAVLILSIPFILGAFAIGAIRAKSAPLRIWPDQLTMKSFVAAAYRLRVSGFLRQNAVTIAVGTITGLLVILISRIL